MLLAIDIRNLQGGSWSGVGVYTDQVIRSLLATDTHAECVLFSNSFSTSGAPIKHNNALNVHMRWPNMFFHAAMRFFQYPQIDIGIEKIMGKTVDVFFSPNFHFTALRRTVPYVITIHDLSFELYPEYYSLKRRLWHALVQPKKQCEQAAAIIVPSHHTKTDLIRLYHIAEEKIHVVYPGMPIAHTSNTNTEIVRNKYNVHNDFFLFVGTIEPRKNIDGIVAAYIRSGLHKKGVELVIAGAEGWKQHALMKRVARTPGVRYLGYIPEEDKQLLFAEAKGCLFPSFYEGFGFPVIEAMQLGTPVITSDRSSLPEIAAGAAYLVNPYDVGAIAKGMERLFEDTALCQELITRGRLVASTYSWDRAAAQMWHIFESVV